MILTLSRRVAGRAACAAGLVIVLLAGGCGDVITFSNKAREEGLRLYSEGMYGDAAGAFRNAIRQEPRDYRSHFYLGVCYDEMKQYQQAFQQYHAAREIMMQTPEGRADTDFRAVVYEVLASAIARNDDRDVELTRAVKRARESQKAEDWLLVAKVYRLKGDADLAIDAYRRACHWDSGNFEIRKEFGLYLLDPLNQAREAEYYLRQAYRMDPNDADVREALARLGVNPPAAERAREPEPTRPRPYTGPLPSAMRQQRITPAAPIRTPAETASPLP